MSLNRYAARKDANHNEVVDALRAAGWLVTSVSAPGFPDLTCVRGGHVVFLEVKMALGKMKRAQVDLHEAWEMAGVRVAVVESPKEATESAYRLADTDAKVRTYRDFPWERYTAEQKARRLATSAARPSGVPPPVARR